MNKVNFIILGAQKCGTTSLAFKLSEHPKLEMLSQKETNFFSNTANWQKELPNYIELFPSQDPNKFYFEASTNYTFYPFKNLNIWNSIFEYNANMKFIYIVRNPVDRIKSSYIHSYERGFLKSSLDDSIRHDSFLITTTRYYTQIKPFIEIFGRENILVIDFEDLVSNTALTLQTICSFLGISAHHFKTMTIPHFNSTRINKKTHHKYDKLNFFQKCTRKFLPRIWRILISRTWILTDIKISSESKEIILRLLENDINQISKIMGKDLTHWKTNSH